MLDNLSANHSSTDVEWCNQTTTQSTGVIQQQNSFKQKKILLLEQPRVLTSTWLRWFGVTSREQFTPDIPRILQCWEKEEWCKIPPDHWAGLICRCRKLWFLWFVSTMISRDGWATFLNKLLLHFRICCPNNFIKKVWLVVSNIVQIIVSCSHGHFTGQNKLQSWPYDHIFYLAHVLLAEISFQYVTGPDHVIG